MAWDEYYDSAAQGRRPSSDFEWYAVDRKGQVAFLTSAGFGAIPMLVFEDKRMYYRAADLFRSLPVRCRRVLHARGRCDWSSWIRVADESLTKAFSDMIGMHRQGSTFQAIRTN
jgi:hypothetical protein